jgi:hypothetical protein
MTIFSRTFQARALVGSFPSPQSRRDEVQQLLASYGRDTDLQSVRRSLICLVIFSHFRQIHTLITSSHVNCRSESDMRKVLKICRPNWTPLTGVSGDTTESSSPFLSKQINHQDACEKHEKVECFERIGNWIMVV